MALYLGSSGKQKININEVVYNMNLDFVLPATDGVILSSSDNYILKDSKGLFLTGKRDE